MHLAITNLGNHKPWQSQSKTHNLCKHPKRQRPPEGQKAKNTKGQKHQRPNCQKAKLSEGQKHQRVKHQKGILRLKRHVETGGHIETKGAC